MTHAPVSSLVLAAVGAALDGGGDESYIPPGAVCGSNGFA
ncbi:hypothetical protein SAMN05421776_11364 [Nocardia farcinica]|uniref:Uncharacterized protein n=1 Tax=Nocardia farcinica TaxID=37329 RepID=A0A0H5PA33_NOCFR|nr:hypothetical protein CJ469_05331 [Nocardia farcinica]PFX06822.1 hypothetical protein CJ468_04222 [Nocardia farcinica]CRY84562.1 Uncharacterised protein [Nocardia farcinica]SIT32659.1 hypothetical protein SAMN05421776_11364 [Nocardia farcinica]